MRKMKLDMSRLTVESFEMAGAADSRGTIQGNASPGPTPPCSGPCSYQQSCVDTICGATCNGSCYTNVVPICC